MFLTESPRSLRYALLLVFVFLLGCNKSEPIKFTESQGQYIGVWQFLYESRTESGFDIKNILLEINADSTAVYRQCIVSKTVSEKSTSSSMRKVSMPNAIIVGLADNEITLEQGEDFLPIGVINMNYDLEITKGPYLENGHWYMGIDNTLLKKLEGSEISTQTEWECPETDEEDKNE
jgi:hypothetical protein